METVDLGHFEITDVMYCLRLRNWVRSILNLKLRES